MNRRLDLPGEPTDERSIVSVSELNRQARTLLERGLSRLWVEGEISNFVHHSSGHMYFSLKDEKSQLQALDRTQPMLPFPSEM